MADDEARPDASKTAFEGKMVSVCVERWDGSEREIVERADSVAVVAVERAGTIVLVRQFRAPARRALVELPAGTVDEGEDPLQTAKRELREETGLHGGRWRAGPVFWTTPGFCRERIFLFFADELETGAASPDAGEAVELVRWSREEASAHLGEIEDAKTLAGLLLYLHDRA